MGIFKLPKWLPAIRSHILEMARVWLVILALKIGLWNIPNTVFAELNDRFVEADTALKEAQASPRTEVLNTRVRVAFEKLIACMRDIKARYFKTPPLLDEDFVSLLLKPPKKKYSPIGKPTAQATGGLVTFGACLWRRVMRRGCVRRKEKRVLLIACIFGIVTHTKKRNGGYVSEWEKEGGAGSFGPIGTIVIP